MSINKIILIVLMMLLPIAAFSSNHVSSNAAAAELTQLLSQTNSMRANFEQFLVSKVGSESGGQHISGSMAFIKPGKFRWQTTGQTNQLIIANNNYVWIYDADLQQVTKRKIDYNDAGNPAILLSGNSDVIQKFFHISELDMPGVGKWFELRPRVKNSSYEWLQLHFVDGQIIAMFTVDNLGQHNEIRFSNIEINPKLPASLFNFVPPKGVDVIE